MPEKRKQQAHPWEHAELTFQLLYWSVRTCHNWMDAAEQLRSLVYVTAKRFLGCLTDGDVNDIAHDVTQEFLRELLYRVFVTYDPARPFFAYAYETLWHVCIAYCKRRANRGFHGLSHEPLDDRRNPLRDAYRREVRGTVGLAVWQIPDDDRQLIYLRYVKCLSIREIAEIVGCTCNAVSIRLTRARNKLKRLLDGVGDYFD